MDAQQEIKQLRDENEQLRNKVAELEQLLEMYDRLARAEDLELKDAYNTLDAHESAQEMSRQELEDAYRTIQAHETVEDRARSELDNAYRTIRAHEALEEHSRQKKLGKKDNADG